MQEHPDVTSHTPFLLLDEKMKILLFPSLISSHSNITSGREVEHAISACEFPTKKWVHVGCEVNNWTRPGSSNYILSTSCVFCNLCTL